MENYAANSHKAKEEHTKPDEEKKVEKVITGPAKTKKKSLASKFAEAFVPEDVTNVGDYLITEVAVPALKKLIDDAIKSSVDMFLYGGRGKARTSTAGRVSYRDYYGANNTAVKRSHYDYEDVILGTRGEAQDVIDRMCELIDTYGNVSVADLYDLVGITGNYTDNKYGWRDIRTASIEHVRDGWMIRMPHIIPLD